MSPSEYNCCVQPFQAAGAPGQEIGGVALYDRKAPHLSAVIAAGKSAYPDYLLSSSYICQAGRSFRDVRRLGFYLNREIKPEIPEILHRRDNVLFTIDQADELRRRGGPFDGEVARLIENSLNPTKPWRIRRFGTAEHRRFGVGPVARAAKRV